MTVMLLVIFHWERCPSLNLDDLPDIQERKMTSIPFCEKMKNVATHAEVASIFCLMCTPMFADGLGKTGDEANISI